MRTKSFFHHSRGIIHYVNGGMLVLMGLYFLVLPACAILYQMTDPALRNGQIPREAVYLFKQLTPKYEKWAKARMASGSAGKLTGADISGTEWPPFGSAFYLWSVESMQEAWEAGDHFMSQPPKEYAKGAVAAATALILDPNTAGWVRDYWGNNYLHQEDVFYRMLMISAATTYQKFTGDTRYLPTLKDQVETLALDIDRSRFGLIDDYPHQCFPADVVAAVANIRQADLLLGTNHSAFALRAMRGFQGRVADARGIPPYMADSKLGEIWGPSRGCSNSYICLFASEAWPKFGAQLYASYEKYFWQDRWGGSGFREFPKDLPGYNWYWDVDSGPVVAGHGISACAFGLGAARTNGRLDHAFSLAAEVLAFSWPLPDGTLLVPRVLSDTTDAPYVGEASILYNLTRRPLPGVDVKTGGNVPWVVYAVLLLLLGRAYFLFRSGIRNLNKWRTSGEKGFSPYPKVHFIIWGLLVLASLGQLLSGHYLFAIIFFVLTQFFPLDFKLGKIFT